MKSEYRKGAEARKNFEETMTKLFRAPKSSVEKPKPKKASAVNRGREK
jgi:hypothetical protein